VLITHKATVDGTCGGQKIPAKRWAASVYVRDGGKWKEPSTPKLRLSIQKRHPQRRLIRRKRLMRAILSRNIEMPHRRHAGGRKGRLGSLESARFQEDCGPDGQRYFIHQYFWGSPRYQGRCVEGLVGELLRCQKVSITDAAGTMLSPTVGILTHRRLRTAPATARGWTRLGHVGLRQARRCLEMDLWH